MRTILIAAAAAALGLAAPAYAQDAPTNQPPAAGQQQAGPQTIRSLSIVDLAELPKETQEQVNQVAAQSSPTDLKKLRGSLDQSPEIKKALADKGLDSSHVIAANLSPQGALTLVTKKTT